uniref:Uncharacterized protein n=1 Tax=Picea glauca TaxID=3330 RepID=A0A101M2P1_PICGL|nr:hypothetical protein ABT39_MTgene3024 [Picea glauca]
MKYISFGGAVQLQILCQVGQYNRIRLSVWSSVGETNLDANGREASDRSTNTRDAASDSSILKAD